MKKSNIVKARSWRRVKTFEMNNFRLIEINSPAPYTALKTDIQEAIQTLPSYLFYNISSSIFRYKALTSRIGRWGIKIGCMSFVGKEAAKLRKWARS